MLELPVYLALLVCPICDAVLHAPTTLHCGHTVCTSHVEVYEPAPPPPSPSPTPGPSRLRRRQPTPPPPLPPSCPLPACPSSAAHRPPSTRINIPSTSRVAYFPAPPPLPTLPVQTRARAEPRVDVTVSKIISLVRRAQKEEQEQGWVHPDDDSETEDESGDPVPSLPPPPPTSSSSPDPTRRPTLAPLHFASGSRPRAPSTSPTSTLRPRKRQKRSGWRRSGGAYDARSWDTGDAKEGGSMSFEKDLMAEVTCEICFMLLYQPVTTPCQHTFCAKCLQRSLDHSSSCPICRTDLPAYAYFQNHPYNQTLLSLILKAFPETYSSLQNSYSLSPSSPSRLDTPIFVCQLSFPGMPTVLHFFEPRYRLMLRRCLESPNPCFGMVMPPKDAPSLMVGDSIPGGNDYGTMLEIRSVQMLADGRSMVETWGTYRFRIMERGALDGYIVGRVERIDDYEEELDDTALAAESNELIPPTPSTEHGRPLFTRLLSPSSSRAPSTPPLPSTPPPRTNEQLMATCHAFLDQLRQGTAPWVVQRLNNTYGPMPTDASSFSFWVALILPIDEYEKAKLLPIKSARLRLRLVVHWIEQLNSNWWFSSGCIIL